MNAYHGLPGWARKWYGSSLEAREMYVFISSIPYILTMALLLWTPIQVIFIALVVSAVGDGSASIIGKSIGKHKFPKWLDHKKSFEGLFAGSFASLLSTIIILLFFPFVNQSAWLVLSIGVGSMAIFAFNDLFNRKIADNITNSLLPAMFAWSLAALFGGL
jgi:dolichol kinase